LNEYKKLVNTKKAFEEKNSKQNASHSNKVVANPNNSSSNPDDLSQSPHLNVYKPTFIINNSFGNEGQPPTKGGDSSSTGDLKKYLKQQSNNPNKPLAQSKV
jgi:hypothetical protein